MSSSSKSVAFAGLVSVAPGPRGAFFGVRAGSGMARRARAIAAITGLIVALAVPLGCSSGSSTGTVTGGIVEVHESTPTTRSGYQPGVVVAQGPSGVVATQNLGAPGQKFTFHLKPGFYLFRATRDQLPADACKASALVSARHTTQVNVLCTIVS